MLCYSLPLRYPCHTVLATYLLFNLTLSLTLLTPLHADEPPWSHIKPLLTEAWYVDCNLERAMDRVYLRHVSTGNSTEVAASRVQNNDKLNALLIYKTMKYADIIIDSAPYKNMEGIW